MPLEPPAAIQSRRPHVRRLAPVLVTALIFVLCSFSILQDVLKYGVNVPFWDEWGWIAELRDLDSGAKTWLDIVSARHGEHLTGGYILFSALVWHLTAMSLRMSMVFNWLVAFGFCVLSAWLTARELGSRSAIPWVVLGASGFFIFNPAAYQLWLWAHPALYVWPYLLFLAGVLLMQSGLAPGTKLVIAGVLAITGTFVAGNGLLLWLMLPLLLCGYHGVRALTANRLHAIVFGVLFSAAATSYTLLLIRPQQSEVPVAACSPAAMASFFLAYTGNLVSMSLSPQPVFLAQGLGALLIVLFLAALWCEVRLATRAARRRVVLIWAVIGSFSLISGALATLARCSLGPTYPLDASRYAQASAFLPIAVVILGAMALEDLAASAPLRWKPYSLLVSLLSVMVFIAVSARYGQARAAEALMQHTRFSELAGKVAALAVKEIPLPAYREIFPWDDPAGFLSSVEFLNRRGWLQPRVWDPRFVNSLPAGEDSPRTGHIDAAAFGNTGLELRGWAYLPERRERAHAVIVTAASGGSPKIVGVAFTSQPRPDVYAATQQPETFATGWTISIAPESIPAGAARVSIRCYGYDAETGKAHLLAHPREVALPPRADARPRWLAEPKSGELKT